MQYLPSVVAAVTVTTAVINLSTGRTARPALFGIIPKKWSRVLAGNDVCQYFNRKS
jgi:hypothetical protein